MISRRSLLLGAAAAPGLIFAQATSDKASSDAERLDLSPIMTPVKHQGQRDTCAYFAFVALWESLLKQQLARDIDLSEEFLIHAVEGKSKKLDNEFTGIPEVFWAAKTLGCVTEAQWPYRADLFVEGSTCQKRKMAHQDLTTCFWGEEPPLALLTQAQQLRLDEQPRFVLHSTGSYGVWQKYATSPARVERVIQTLATSKRPQIVTIKLPHDYAGWRDDGEVVVPPSLEGQSEAEMEKIPNHFAALTGFDRAAQMFYFKNSWGTGWGNKGYGRIGFDAFTTAFIEGSNLFGFRGAFTSPPPQL